MSDVGERVGAEVHDRRRAVGAEDGNAYISLACGRRTKRNIKLEVAHLARHGGRQRKRDARRVAGARRVNRDAVRRAVGKRPHDLPRRHNGADPDYKVCR